MPAEVSIWPSTCRGRSRAWKAIIHREAWATRRSVVRSDSAHSRANVWASFAGDPGPGGSGGNHHGVGTTMPPVESSSGGDRKCNVPMCGRRGSTPPTPGTLHIDMPNCGHRCHARSRNRPWRGPGIVWTPDPFARRGRRRGIVPCDWRGKSLQGERRSRRK